MVRFTHLRRGLCAVFIVMGLLSALPSGAYTAPPTAPTWSANGSYSVSWASACTSYCLSQWLEERVGSGSFAAVAIASPRSFTAKPIGQYDYRVGRLIYDYGAQYYETEYSTVVTVYVSPSPPLADPLLTQRDYRYEARIGDINYDGRRDLFVNRVSGGAAGNGVVDKLIIQQTATPGQYLLVPPTSAQAAAATGWPISTARVAVEDVNVDGFVDVAVKGLGAAINVASAKDLIVYSPGQPFSSVPKGARLVDDGVLKFVGNMLDYEVNANYFADNADITYYYYNYYWSTCGGSGYGGDPILVDWSGGCFWVYQPVFGYYFDYSKFSSAAVAIWRAGQNIQSGQISTTAGTDQIDRAAEGVLNVQIGGWNMNEVLGSSGEHTNPDSRRALEVFWSILGVGRAYADEVRTAEAPAQTPRQPGTIYVTKRDLAGPLALHVALEYSSPVSVFRTISAYDSDERAAADGRLISEKNWVKDLPPLMMTVAEVRRQPVDPTNDAYWLRLLAADSAYVDGSLAYDLIPSVGSGGYNCSSYSHGILNATGGSAVGVPSNGNWTNMWGWGVPVPASAFR